MTTTLDETLRQMRRDAILALGEEHDTLLAADIERTLSAENMEKLRSILEEQASDVNRSVLPNKDIISFCVGVRLIEVITLLEEYPNARISAPHSEISPPLKNLKTGCIEFGPFYSIHPLIADAVKRVQKFCGPTTQLEKILMKTIEDTPAVSLRFKIPMTVGA